MKSKEEFVRQFDEWLFKELLLAYHAHHDHEWLIRCTRTLPDKVTKTLEKMYDFIVNTKDAAQSTTRPSAGNGQQGTRPANAAPSMPETPRAVIGGSKPTTSSGSGGQMRPAIS